MPIRAEEKDRYPKDWHQISLRIRERASWRCEWCGVPNGQLGGRLSDGTWCRAEGWDHPGDRPVEGQEGACSSPGGRRVYLRIIRIVLTVAHLDHQPENCAPENLKALCQRCHNYYDMPRRRAGIRERARSALGMRDMFAS